MPTCRSWPSRPHSQLHWWWQRPFWTEFLWIFWPPGLRFFTCFFPSNIHSFPERSLVAGGECLQSHRGWGFPHRVYIKGDRGSKLKRVELGVLSQLAGLSKFTFQVDEEEDMGEGIQPGPFTFHLEVHSCTQTQDRFPKVVSFVVYEFPHGDFYVVIIFNCYTTATCAPTRRGGRLEL